MRKFFPHCNHWTALKNFLKNQTIIINFFSTNLISLCQIITTSQIQNIFKHSIVQAIQLYVCMYLQYRNKPLFLLSTCRQSTIMTYRVGVKIILQGYISIASWNFYSINIIALKNINIFSISNLNMDNFEVL